MKLISFLLILGINVCSAVNSYSQTTRLSLSLENKTLKEVFSNIEKKSEFIFFYYDNAIDTNKRVSINVENETINNILNEVLKGSENSYTISDRQIYISKSKTSVSQNASKRITGTVTDIAKEPLPGVTVHIKGTNVAVSTDVDGRFEISVPDVISDPTLVFTYIGFMEQEVNTEGKTELSVVLREKEAELDEVVIVGYGTQKKASVVGSVQTVRPDELKVPTTSLSNSFAGRLAGVIAVQRTGEPGADGSNFWIRGVSTTSTSTPLIIIDGVQASQGDLNNLAPEMIESFSVLKDATATSLYGTLGANGVMIVNTKSGVVSGKPNINVRIEQNFNTPVNTPKTVGGIEYMNLYNEAYRYRRAGGTPYSDEKIAGTAAGYDNLIFPNVDWYNEMFKELSMSQSANLNVQGGGQKADYYLGVNVSHEGGMLNNLSKDYYSFGNNIDLWKYVFQNNVNVRLTPSSKIYLRLNVQLRDYNGPQQGTSTIFNRVMQSNPVDYPIVYPAGDPRDVNGLAPEHIMWGGISGDENYNPIAEMSNGYIKDFQSTVIATLGFDQKLDFITPGLSFNGYASFKNWTRTQTSRYFGSYNKYNITSYTLGNNGIADSYSLVAQGNPTTPVLTTGSSHSGDRTIYVQGQLDYSRIFNKVHDIRAMFLYNQREYNLNVPNANSFINSLPQRKQGLAGRLSYAYDQKYLAEVNFGYNGSENFAKGHRWGFFPSVALGYNISQESYFEPLKKAITNLKLRGSVGKVGNDQGQDRYLYLANITLQSDYRSYTTGTNKDLTINGPMYNRFANPLITWEVGTKYNIGMDLQLFNDWNIMFDVFRENRKNIFEQRQTIPAFLGTADDGLTGDGTKHTTVVYGNLGAVKNQGFDFAVNYDKQVNKDLFVSARGTFTYAHNERTATDEAPNLLYPNTSKIGTQVGQYFALVAERLFIDQADIDNSPYQTFGTVLPGDIKYVDINGDGQIDNNDKIYTGYPATPEITYGFGVSSQFKKFDMSVFFQGVARTSLLMQNVHPFGTSSSRAVYNVLDWVAESRWNPENPDPYASYPALSLQQLQNTTATSTYWMRDGSFLKLRSIELGYTNSFYRIYVSGNNLLTFSKFKHWDPEMGSGSGFRYPNQRIFNVGVQMNF